MSTATLLAPFVFLDSTLPVILFIVSILILSGNFIVKRFFDRCGVDIIGRYTCGLLICSFGIFLASGISSCHATTALIFMLIFLAARAMRDGERQIASANIAIAAVLVPVVMA